MANIFVIIIAAIALLSVISLVYSAVATQSIDSKISAREIVLVGLKTNTSISPPVTLQTPTEITITTINASDRNIISLEPLIQQIGQLQVIKIKSINSLDINSAEANGLIQKYQIEKIPTMIIEGTAGKQNTLTQGWASLGSIENDGSLVIRNVPPLYLEVKTGNIRGVINATFIGVSDKNVFEASLFGEILKNSLGIIPLKENTVDYKSPEGRVLIANFGIKKVPTFILSGDLNAYDNLAAAWNQIGAIDTQGNFVFQKVELLAGLTYLDLNGNEVIEVPAQAQ